MDVKKVLWPTDFSKNAAEALPYVTSLTEKFQTEVHVLYVIDDLGHPDDPWYGELDGSHAAKIHDWEKEKAAKDKGKALEELQNALKEKEATISSETAEIEDLHKQLDAKVAEREKKLVELEKSCKELKAALEAKDQALKKAGEEHANTKAETVKSSNPWKPPSRRRRKPSTISPPA